MSEAKTTKTCPLCYQDIDARAKKCPFCQHWQRTWFFFQANVPGMIWVSATFLFMLAYGWFFERMLGNRDEFLDHSGAITILSSAIVFGELTNRPTVAVVGIATNTSELPWNEVQFEAQFFDAGGHLIDVGGTESSSTTLLPHGDMGFKVEVRKTLPKDRYAAHKVHVRFAKDARRPF